MLPLTRYEVERRLRGAVVLTVMLDALAVFAIALFPTMSSSGVDFDEYINALPPQFREAFAVTDITTIEGFLVTEFYQFAWLILLGIYVAYRAGGLVAGDLETDRLDLVLAAPISRRRYLAEKSLALVPTMVLVNVGVFVVVYAGVVLIGETVPIDQLAMIHVLSIPYLLACAALGIAISVVVDSADVGQRAGLGLVFGLFLLDSMTASTDAEALGLLSPTHYFDTAAILVRGEYDLAAIAILLAAAAVAWLGAQWWFARRDLA